MCWVLGMSRERDSARAYLGECVSHYKTTSLVDATLSSSSFHHHHHRRQQHIPNTSPIVCALSRTAMKHVIKPANSTFYHQRTL